MNTLAAKFRIIKPEIRVLGVDDGPFTFHRGHAVVVGVVFRGGYWLDGVLSTRVKVDGFDATNKISSMILKSSHYKQLRIVMLSGITFGGFNVVDIQKLNALTHLPIIVVTRTKPNFEEIHAALEKLPRPRIRWKAVQNAGPLFEIQTQSRTRIVYVETCGIRESNARDIVQFTSTRSSIPEALRAAHLIASAVSQH